MLIRWEERDWSLDIADLTNRQAMAIETEMGMTLAEFYDKFEGGEEDGSVVFDAAKPYFLKIMTIVYWLMLDQNGVRVKIADVEFPVIRFAQAIAEGMVAEAAAALPATDREAGPGPTQPPAASPPSRGPSSRSRTKTPAAAGSPDG